MGRQKIKALPPTAKRIAGSKDYVDVDGRIYTPVSNYKGHGAGYFAEKSCRLNKNCGYLYCGIYYYDIKKCKTRRVNRIVAETFIPNPDNLPVVGHRNNIKTQNNVENLYWTTLSENSQKAVNDGLLVNKKGADDSQSKPVAMYDTKTNKCLQVFGSICEAVRETGLPKTTVARQAKYHRPVRRPYYFRYLDDKTAPPQQLVGHFVYDTDELLGLYINTTQAARATNSNPKTVSQQCHLGKPKHKFSNSYFGYVNSKCEQTIESDK